MLELLGGIAGLLLAVLYITTPFFAIVAWVRSRRLDALEQRLREAEYRLRMMEATPLAGGSVGGDVPRSDATAAPLVEPTLTLESGAPSERRSASKPPPLPEIMPNSRPISSHADDGTEPPDGTASEPRFEPETPARPPVPWFGGWHAISDAWEDRIGGSVLSKAGALLVVIGVSLFVGWSMVHLGPVGRVGVAVAVSGCLLAAGLAFQRWPAYRSVALGLAAAGWGGLYVTAYATHGLESARVIDDPGLALGMLLVVAAGMIVHALWLGVPMLVAVAYVAAFAAVALGPASTYAVLACVVLAGTLLAVSFTRGWSMFAVGGVLCTYGTLALRFPPPGELTGGWVITTGYALIWVCWLMFESFDIMATARGQGQADASRVMMPLNLCGLLGVSTLQWPSGVDGYDLLLAAAAVAYGVSALCRVVIGRRSHLSDGAAAVDGVAPGSYEVSLAIATVLWAMALWMRFDTGWRLHVGLLMEAEVLFLAGVVFRQRYLRSLAAAVFVVLVIRFIACDVPLAGEVMVRGLTLCGWTPSALLAAALLAANRVIIAKSGQQPLLVAEHASASVATALVAMVLAGETWHRHNGLGPEMLGIAWLVLAWMLLQSAVRFRSVEAYLQACFLGFLAVVPLVLVNAFPMLSVEGAGDQFRLWVWLAPAVAILYALGWQVLRSRLFPVLDLAEADIGQASLLAAAILSLVLLWHALPAPLVALGWGGFAILSFQVGLGAPHAGLRWHAYVAVVLMVGRLFLANFTNAGMTGFVSHRLLTVVPVILLLYDLASRLADARLRGCVGQNERAFGRICSWAATAMLVVLLRFELGRVLAVVGWAVVGVALLVLGRRRGATHLRWQSHAIALLTFARSWGTHFYVPEAPGGWLQPSVLGGAVVGSLFLSEMLCPPDVRVNHPLSGPGRLLAWLDAHRRTYYGMLGTALLAILLVHEMPTALLTAALGIEGASLLVLGFVRRDRGLRTCGLAVLGICLPKLFLYDLRHLDTPYRILSFLLLGILLLGASWVYARFKSRLQDIV